MSNVETVERCFLCSRAHCAEDYVFFGLKDEEFVVTWCEACEEKYDRTDWGVEEFGAGVGGLSMAKVLAKASEEFDRKP